MFAVDASPEAAAAREKRRRAQETYDESPEGRAEAQAYTYRITALNEERAAWRARPCVYLTIRIVDHDEKCTECATTVPSGTLALDDRDGHTRCVGCAIALPKRHIAVDRQSAISLYCKAAGAIVGSSVIHVEDRCYHTSAPDRYTLPLGAHRRWPALTDLDGQRDLLLGYVTEAQWHADPRPTCTRCARHHVPEPELDGIRSGGAAAGLCAWCRVDDQDKTEREDSKAGPARRQWA